MQIIAHQNCKGSGKKLDNRIKKIAIVGRDADAWLTSLMLQLSFAKSSSPVEVKLIELPSKIHPHDFYSVLPSHKILHKVLGINENVLFKASSQYSLGQRFVNWTNNESFFHCYDTHGISMGYVDFFQYWIKARNRMQLDVPLEDFSLGVELAKQGRFVSLGESSDAFSKATYGYHLNALSYLRIIAKAAVNAGLQYQTNQIKDVRSENGFIKSILLDDGTTIEADLFVDASGEEAVLISKLEDSGNYESWSRWLPCDRQIQVSAPPLSPMPVFAQIAAFKHGWMGFFPLLNRTALTSVYSSSAATTDDVVKNMEVISRARMDGFVEKTISAGARKKCWIGNCIALGTAAVSLEPLDAVQLHLLHVGLSWLRSLFPNDKNLMPESDVFNFKMQSHAVNIRDFQIAHYKLNRRAGDPFWDKLRTMEVPETLERKLKLFSYRGVVGMLEDETFQEENWTSILVGHGLIPSTYDPLVDKISEEDHVQQFQRILQYVQSEAQKMPTIEAHIEMNSDNPYQSMF